MFISDVDIYIDKLERYYIFSVALVRIVGITNHMAEHQLDVFFRILESFKLSDENSSVFELTAYLFDLLFIADRFTGRVRSNID